MPMPLQERSFPNVLYVDVTEERQVSKKCQICLFNELHLIFHLLQILGWITLVLSVRNSDEDFEDLDEDVYCSIAVTKHM